MHAIAFEPGRAYVVRNIRDPRCRAAVAAPQVDNWLEWLKSRNLRPASLLAYEKRVQPLLRLYPETPLEKFTEAELLVAMNTVPPLSRRSTTTAFISLFRHWAWRRDLIPKDPTKLLGEIKHPKQKYVETFTDAEVEALTAMPGEEGMHLLLMFDTGLRISELCNLRVRDVQPPRGPRCPVVQSPVDLPEELLVMAEEWGVELRPRVEHQLAEQSGDWGQIIVLDGKGGKDRVVPVTRRLSQRFAEWSLLEGANPDDFVFGHRKPGGHPGVLHRELPLSVDAVRKWFYDVCVRAGARRLRPHTTRHTYATMLLKRGASIEKVSKLLGHSSVGITSTTYSHLATDDVRDVVALLELVEA